MKSWAMVVRNFGRGVNFIMSRPTDCSGLKRAVKYGNISTENFPVMDFIFFSVILFRSLLENELVYYF